MVNINKQKSAQTGALVKDLLREFDARARDILEKRYGLTGGETWTLAKIGNDYHITRERVRQIEALGLREVGRRLSGGPLGDLVQAAFAAVRDAGGVRRANLLVRDLLSSGREHGGPAFANAVQFILEASGKLLFRREDDVWHSYWYLDREHEKSAQALSLKCHELLKRNKAAVLGERKLDELLNGAFREVKLSPGVAQGYLSISKNFATNQFGEFGLAEWPEINPKTAREWAYTILRREQRPLHFREIAEKISEFRKSKKTNFQTVHNELIKDGKFLLVGRGMYGLKEFNILPGTAREVITHFLKKQGPLSFAELKKMVLAERHFKENTLLINLQSKDYFKKLEDGRYALREA